MSGPGGGGGGGGRVFPTDDGGGSGGEDDCASLVVETPLNSPDASVVSTLKKRTLLEVKVMPTDQGRQRLVAVTAGGKVAGSITSPQLAQLIRCMERGYKYQAEVLEVNGGEVRVRVSAK